jgi:pyrimidine deaminase RibD-like protein
MILVVVGVTDEGYLLLADGKTRKLETPKKKKKKHAEVLALPQIEEQEVGMLTNRKLREAVKSAVTLLTIRKE